MNITLTKIEMAVLLLQLNFMRENVRKGFKKKYKDGAKTRLQLFDSLKPQLTEYVDALVSDQDVGDIEYTEEQMLALSSFIDWYLEELYQVFNKAGRMTEEDIKLLESLENIQEKTDAIKEIFNIA